MTLRRRLIMAEGVLQQLLRLVVPKPDPSFQPPPRAIGPGIWVVDRRVFLGGARLASRATVVDVGAGGIAIISPPADVTDEIERLGTVEAIVAPNSFHYLHASAWLGRHPNATFFVAPELPRRVAGLPPAIELAADAAPPWREALPFVVLGPDRGVSEVVFFHRASRTLVLTDVASNLVDVERLADRLAFRVSGMPRGFGPTRNSRRLLLRDRTRVRETLRAVMQWPFERIVVAHGAVVERDAADVFVSAFAKYVT
jgi:hypothetical protein